jgi:hypothetical protein
VTGTTAALPGSKPRIWFAALGAATIVISGSLAIHFLADDWHNAPSPGSPVASEAGFIGSETCDG